MTAVPLERRSSALRRAQLVGRFWQAVAKAMPPNCGNGEFAQHVVRPIIRTIKIINPRIIDYQYLQVLASTEAGRLQSGAHSAVWSFGRARVAGRGIDVVGPGPLANTMLWPTRTADSCATR